MCRTHNWLKTQDVSDLELGARLLGSGGGGSPRVAALILTQLLASRGPIELVRHSAGYAACVGAIGSPTVMQERLPGPAEFVAAVRALEQRIGVEIEVVVPLEIGGVNGLLAPCAAHWLGLPLWDADAMGRAFPNVLDVSPVEEISLGPLALAGPSGDTVVVQGHDDQATQACAVSVLNALGAWAAVCAMAVPATQLGPLVIEGSITRAVTLGRELRMLRGGERLADGQIEPIFAGVVSEVLRDDAQGVATLLGTSDPPEVMRLDFATEYTSALVDGQVRAAHPDVIAVIGARDWRPVDPDALVGAQQLSVFRIPVNEQVHRIAARSAQGAACRQESR